jgi:O-antigen/teichoic acid export membrane protein
VPSRIALLLGFMSNRFFLRSMGGASSAEALAQVGLFSLGHKFGVIIYRFINGPFNSFWGPRRFELLLEDGGNAKEVLSRVCTYSTMVSIYAALVISAGSQSLIRIMTPDSYDGAHQVVPFVALAYVAMGVEVHFSTGMLHAKRTMYATYISLISVLVVLGWNWLFVARYGLIGAATSNLAGFAFRLTFIYRTSQKLYPIPYELRRMGLGILAATGVYLGCRQISFDSALLTLLTHLVISGLYPVLLAALGFFRQDERRWLMKNIRSRLTSPADRPGNAAQDDRG